MDDNAVAPTDVGNQIDNFSLHVTAGSVPGLVGTLDAPTNNALVLTGTAVVSSVSVFNGTPPYVVQFWTNSGVGNTSFAIAGDTNAPPYALNLGALPAGIYNLYATVTDANGLGFTTNTLTNMFSVVAPI